MLIKLGWSEVVLAGALFAADPGQVEVEALVPR